MAKDYDIIRDPIHGFIKINNLEKEIVDSQAFQRLRNIRQLALTNFVYPGAEHSRFSHSLGVMEFATKVFNTVVFKSMDELQWDEKRIKRNRQFLRLVALLHDIGHAPFSHASEDLFEHGFTHESYAPMIIKNTEIYNIINKFPEVEKIDIKADDVIGFFTGDLIDEDMAFLKEIYAGEVDVDKMDYLLRDSLFTGVHYGKFDYERLIHTLCLIPNPLDKGSFLLAIEEGGLHSLEALVLARYFMFTQVYFHRIRRAYDLHLLEFLRRKVGKYPKDVNEFLLWDDIRVWQMMKENVGQEEDAKCIVDRRHFVEVFHTPEHCTDVDKTRFRWLQEKTTEKFPTMRILYDEADKVPHKFKKVDFYVKGNDGPQLVTNASEIINNLKKIQEFRIYVDRNQSDPVEEFCREFWRQKKSI